MGNKINVIIPAAGPGKRMKSYGPKCMIDILGKTLLCRQIEIIRENIPDSDITVTIGFQQDKVKSKLKNQNIRLCENEYFLETNVAFSIYEGIIAAKANDNALIIYGDLVFNTNTLQNLDFTKSFAILDNKHQIRYDEVGVFYQGNTIYRFTFSGETKWAQIVYLTGKEFDLFCEGMEQDNTEKYFGFELLNYIIDNNGSIEAVFKEDMRIAEIDSTKDILQAERIYEIPNNINQQCS